jgi:hypothetical protein
MRRTEDPCQDRHWQDVLFSTSWEHLRLVPLLEGPPPSSLRLARQVFSLHDKSSPRTASLRLARQAAHSHELFPSPTEAWAMTRGAAPRCKRLLRDTWGLIPRTMQTHQLAAGASIWPREDLNTALLNCAPVTSPSPLTLQHACFARGTQAPPKTSSDLRLGHDVAS